MHSPANGSVIVNSEILTALCHNIREATAIVRPADAKVLFCNAAWNDLFELEHDQQFDLIELDKLRRSPLSNEEQQRRLDVVSSKGYFSEEVEYLSKHGRPFWGELTIRPFNHGGEHYYFVVIERIDTIKKRESRIAQDKQRFDALLEHASMGIIETNAQARIISINRFALSLFGYNPSQLIGEPIEVLIPNRFRNRHVGHRDHYIAQPKSRPMGVGMDLFAVKSDGTEFPVEVSLSHYFLDDSQFIIAFISDISVRKKSELEIKKLNDILEEKVDQRTKQLRDAVQELKLSKEELGVLLEREKELSELKSRFVSMASHEFRTPLSTVLSSAYLLEQYTKGEDQPKRERHLKRIISSVKMLTDILNDFLSVGKIEEGKIHVNFSAVEIEKITSDLVDEIRDNLKSAQEINYRHEGPAVVYLDASLYKHIVMNLMSNASKFSPEHSVIYVETRSDGHEFSLSVRDQGIGISWDDQKHLMERFFRGTNAVNIQGTGLGLHIVAKYSELMNGKLECKSELGKGTVFTVSFKI